MMEVTVKTTVEVAGVERDVELKFLCYPSEASSREYPGHPAGAEFQSGVFCETGEAIEGYDFPADYEDEALELAAEIERRKAEDAVDAKDAAAEAKWEERREERRGGA